MTLNKPTFESLEGRRMLDGVQFTDRLAEGLGSEAPPFMLVTGGDFNGDGRDDIAASRGRSPNVYVYEGTGDGTLQAPRVIGGEHSEWVSDRAIGTDMNGDGVDEIAVRRQLGEQGSQELWFYDLAGAGDPMLTWRTPIERGMALQGAADFNGDGRDDLLVSRAYRGGVSRMGVMFATRRGYADPVMLRARYGTIRETVTGDFNGDGLKDFALADSGSELHVVTSRSRNRFGGVAHQPLDPNARSSRELAAGDVNGDRRDDLAFLYGTADHSGEDDGTRTVSLFLSTATGAPEAARETRFTDGRHTLVLADVDGDGRADLVGTDDRTAVQNSGMLKVNFSDGRGGWRATGEDACDTQPGYSNTLIPLDFNGDDRIDFAQLNSFREAMMIRINDGA